MTLQTRLIYTALLCSFTPFTTTKLTRQTPTLSWTQTLALGAANGVLITAGTLSFQPELVLGGAAIGVFHAASHRKLVQAFSGKKTEESKFENDFRL